MESDASPNYGRVSSQSVKKATGKTWDEWFTLLDAAGARSMTHKDIAVYIYKNLLPRDWWCQMLTVGYEQARGMRSIHETTDGYAVSIGKTYPFSIDKVYEYWSDTAKRNAWLEGSFRITKATKNKSLRARAGKDEKRISVYFYRKGKNKSSVSVQVERLAGESEVKKNRIFWKQSLTRLATVLTGL